MKESTTWKPLSLKPYPPIPIAEVYVRKSSTSYTKLTRFSNEEFKLEASDIGHDRTEISVIYFSKEEARKIYNALGEVL